MRQRPTAEFCSRNWWDPRRIASGTLLPEDLAAPPYALEDNGEGGTDPTFHVPHGCRHYSSPATVFVKQSRLLGDVAITRSIDYFKREEEELEEIDLHCRIRSEMVVDTLLRLLPKVWVGLQNYTRKEAFKWGYPPSVHSKWMYLFAPLSCSTLWFILACLIEL